MTTLHRYILLLVAALIAALAGGCASTTITSSWKDQDLGRVRFRKVLVVFQPVAEVVRVTSLATGEMLKARG